MKPIRLNWNDGQECSKICCLKSHKGESCKIAIEGLNELHAKVNMWMGVPCYIR